MSVVASIDGTGNADIFAGNDTHVPNSGFGSSTAGGKDGVDTLLFICANIAESVIVLVDANRAHVTRDSADIAVDINCTRFDHRDSRDAASPIKHGDLTGTATRRSGIDLARGCGASDGSADTVAAPGSGCDNTLTTARATCDRIRSASLLHDRIVATRTDTITRRSAGRRARRVAHQVSEE